MKLGVDYGAMVVGQMPHSQAVIPNSPAHKAGLKEKDIVLECDSVKITPEWTIQDILEEKEVGDIMKMKVMRGKKTFAVEVKLTERK